MRFLERSEHSFYAFGMELLLFSGFDNRRVPPKEILWDAQLCLILNLSMISSRLRTLLMRLNYMQKTPFGSYLYSRLIIFQGELPTPTQSKVRAIWNFGEMSKKNQENQENQETARKKTRKPRFATKKTRFCAHFQLNFWIPQGEVGKTKIFFY